ncbi:unnamed protein product [Cunninghamella echinulata]
MKLSKYLPGKNNNDNQDLQADQEISLDIPEEKATEYPPIIKKMVGGVSFVWNRLIVDPFLLVWRFLYKHTTLTHWIVFSMVVGILVGHFSPESGKNAKPFGDAFIRMIQIVEVPLIFSTLVVGIVDHGDDVTKVGKLAVKSIIYFEVVTTFALAVGLIMANLIKPGEGVTLPPEDANSGLPNPDGKISWETEFKLVVPKNFFVAAHEGSILGIVFCAAMFSCATMLADKTSKKFMLRINSSLSQISFKLVKLIMNYAPIGIGCALAATIGQNGIDVLKNLGRLIGSLYASLAIFVILILIPVMLLARIPIFGFFKAVAQPWLIAFSSASSESALPKAFENMRAFGCPNAIVGFVIPCGYSFNLDGTTLYLALASIFAAQAAGMNLDIATQLSIMGTLMLSSKGVAAIPRASLIVLIGTLQQYGLPTSAATLIMGVDAIMDMVRTSVNVFGNCLGSCVMARIEGEFRGPLWREEELARRLAASQSRENPADDDNLSVQDVEHHNDHLKSVVVHHEEKPTGYSSSVRSAEIQTYEPKH